jgi:hypothetical protein
MALELVTRRSGLLAGLCADSLTSRAQGYVTDPHEIALYIRLF